MQNRGKLGKGRSRERGYVLLILMLFVAILTITAAVVAPEIVFQVRRDREEEMIHRGVQYSRAIRRYVKKFGRYPTRLEELENTNNIRFLRKRYKDPITNKDFRMLHIGEVQLMPGSGIAGAVSLGAPAGANPQNLNTPNPATGAKPEDPNQPGTDTNTTGGDAKADGGGDKLSGQVFGGGPIVGVASTSKAESIREFNNKDHYNQWQFIYDPSTDRGGLLNTPSQPPLQGATPMQAPAPGMNPAQQAPNPPQQQPAPEPPQTPQQ